MIFKLILHFLAYHFNLFKNEALYWHFKNLKDFYKVSFEVKYEKINIIQGKYFFKNPTL